MQPLESGQLGVDGQTLGVEEVVAVTVADVAEAVVAGAAVRMAAQRELSLVEPSTELFK